MDRLHPLFEPRLRGEQRSHRGDLPRTVRGKRGVETRGKERDGLGSVRETGGGATWQGPGRGRIWTVATSVRDAWTGPNTWTLVSRWILLTAAQTSHLLDEGDTGERTKGREDEGTAQDASTDVRGTCRVRMASVAGRLARPMRSHRRRAGCGNPYPQIGDAVRALVQATNETAVHPEGTPLSCTEQVTQPPGGQHLSLCPLGFSGPLVCWTPCDPDDGSPASRVSWIDVSEGPNPDRMERERNTCDVVAAKQRTWRCANAMQGAMEARLRYWKRNRRRGNAVATAWFGKETCPTFRKQGHQDRRACPRQKRDAFCALTTNPFN